MLTLIFSFNISQTKLKTSLFKFRVQYIQTVELYIIVIRITYPKLTYIQRLKLPISEQYRTDLKFGDLLFRKYITADEQGCLEGLFSRNVPPVTALKRSLIFTIPPVRMQVTLSLITYPKLNLIQRWKIKLWLPKCLPCCNPKTHSFKSIDSFYFSANQAIFMQLISKFT